MSGEARVAWVHNKTLRFGIFIIIVLWPLGGAQRGLMAFCRKRPERCNVIRLCFLCAGLMIFSLGAAIGPARAFLLSLSLLGTGVALMGIGHTLDQWQWSSTRRYLILRLARQATKFRAGNIAALAEAEGLDVLAEAVSQMPTKAVKGVAQGAFVADDS